MLGISEETLNTLERLSRECDLVPWTSMVEGREFLGGDDFIMTGGPSARGEDLHVLRDGKPAPVEYLDLIAAARTYLPVLVDEVRSLRARLADQESGAG